MGPVSQASHHQLVTMNQVNVSEKTLFLAGGAGCLGRALASLLLTRGGKVFIMDRDKEALAKVLEDLGSRQGTERVQGACGDVRNRQDWLDMWDICSDKLGVPQILINLVEEDKENDMEEVYDTNVKGWHLCVSLALEKLSLECGGGGGVVLGVSSHQGVTCQGPQMYCSPAVTASRHAVTALTRTYGNKFWHSRTGVSVVCAAPTDISTPSYLDSELVTEDTAAAQLIGKARKEAKLLSTEEAALKLFNLLGAQSGSVWLVRPGMFPPFSVPDYTLPKTKTIYTQPLVGHYL